MLLMMFARRGIVCEDDNLFVRMRRVKMMNLIHGIRRGKVDFTGTPVDVVETGFLPLFKDGQHTSLSCRQSVVAIET